jgi:hypothetical protein
MNDELGSIWKDIKIHEIWPNKDTILELAWRD